MSLQYSVQESRFKNGLLQFQQKSTWYTFQDWSPGGLICPKYNQIELHNIDLLVQQVSKVQGGVVPVIHVLYTVRGNNDNM